jgi:hypothetical protein
MRALSFYLPQFHPTPENDRWWGRGFTEWTNVAAARPLFRGHHQPHIPADLGFYDLRLDETRAAQAEMAAAHGISGFCYYHYWFNGRRVLERPFDEVLASGRPDFPFCLCWANENWTRRWDGLERDVLMGQDFARYSPEEHYRWLAPAFADARYVRVDGRPLFLVYKANLLPEVERIVDAWRTAAARDGSPDPYICGMFSPGNTMSYEAFLQAGFDAVVDFYPKGLRPFVGWLGRGAGQSAIELIRGVRRRFEGRFPQRTRPTIHSYERLMESACAAAPAGDRVFPCVIPSWDNTPRLKRRATIIQNEDAGLYGRWLAEAVRRVERRPEDEQIVFINAWNEWGEGCHLEPDVRLGRRFLEATREVMEAARARQSTPAQPREPRLAMGR